MEKQTDAASRLLSLLKRGVTFAMYSLPGRHDFEFVVDDNVSEVVSPRKFTVTMWDGRRIDILDRKVPDSVCTAHESTAIHNPYGESTSWVEYETGINKVTGLLKSNPGKVVISRRVILADCRLDYDMIVRCAFDMFATYGKSFRAVYYTPTTGAWCVCSPELLLSINKESGELHTVALAGTRRADCGASEWDNKNKREHSYVVRYICDVIESFGIIPEHGDAETVPAGSIEHILTKISGNVSGVNGKVAAEKIVAALHPTPAICGYPLAWSKKIISEVEKHDRKCYGGYIAMEDDTYFIAHVNLRSFAFTPGYCCFWGGGGIMSESSPTAEWEEASLKINTSQSFFNKELGLGRR